MRLSNLPGYFLELDRWRLTHNLLNGLLWHWRSRFVGLHLTNFSNLLNCLPRRLANHFLQLQLRQLAHHFLQRS